MTDRYVLIGQTPVPCEDLMEWACWLESSREQRIVKQSIVLDTIFVSTIFLGLDHNLSDRPKPVLFETMAFWGEPGGGSLEQFRCGDWSEAERQHEAVLQYVAKPSAMLGYFWGIIRWAWRDCWEEFREISGRVPPEPTELERAVNSLLRRYS